MSLPTCECVAGQPTQQQLANIYCALYTLAQGGGSDVTYPLSPTRGGTGVANAAGETITLNGGFALQLTLTGATNVTLPTSGTIQVFDQSLSTTDSPTFAALSVDGAINNATGLINTGNLIFGSVGGGADTPVADGTYTVGLGVSQNGTITTSNGVIISIQEAMP